MSIRLLTAGKSYQILASEKDSSGNALAVTFKGEDSGLTVTPSSDSDDNQVWLLAGSSGSWALTPRNTLFYASPTKSGKNVQAEERGEAFHWDVTADDGNPTEIRTTDKEKYWGIGQVAANQPITLSVGSGFPNQKWFLKSV